MDITPELFYKSCPVALAPDDSIFNTVKEFFPGVETTVRGIVGSALFDELDADGTLPVADIAALICSYALYSAVPQLDLVLTPTGFGVVSTDVVAPASPERVRNLRSQLMDNAASAHDSLIAKLCKMERWNSSPDAKRVFSTMFVSVRDFADISRRAMSFTTRSELYPEIVQIERELSRVISPELIQAMRDGARSASLSPMQEMLRQQIKAYMSMWVKHDGSSFGKDRMLLQFVEENIDDFPQYRDSQTYKANHFQRYENKAEDSCFFFSGGC